jgi:hypothetical protein
MNCKFYTAAPLISLPPVADIYLEVFPIGF